MSPLFVFYLLLCRVQFGAVAEDAIVLLQPHAPVSKETAVNLQQAAPAAQDAIVLLQHHAPLAEDETAFSKQHAPVAENAIVLLQQHAPVAEDGIVLSQQHAPMAKAEEAIVLLQQSSQRVLGLSVQYPKENFLESSVFASEPLRSARTPMTPTEHFQSIRDIQKFIADSSEGFATLVLMGDSTMSGITTELLNITSSSPGDPGCIYELIYVSNDRARSVNYGCNRGCGGVPPGGEWVLESALTDDMARKTAERAKASTKALHDKGCKSGGGLETYIFRTGPFKGLVVHHWGFLPEYTDFCWEDCMTEAMAALKPSAVLWNIGLHLLNHDFKPSVCATRKNPTKTNCGNYKDMVTLATRSMLSSGIQSVVWKSTNWLCEDIQSEGFPLTKEALIKWHDEARRHDLEEQCHEECPEYKSLSLPCYEWFMDAHTSTRMYLESNQGLAELRAEFDQGVHLLDAYTVTKECCDADCHIQTDDGEHYTGLDKDLVLGLTSVLAKRTENA